MAPLAPSKRRRPPPPAGRGGKPPPKPRPKKARPPPPASDDSSDAPLSDDDFDFVAAHGARLGFLDDVGDAPAPGTVGAPAHAPAAARKRAAPPPASASPSSSDNDDERDYERAPRGRLGKPTAAKGGDADAPPSPARDRAPPLPVKTLAGVVLHGADAAAAAGRRDAAVAAAARVPGVLVFDDGGEETDGGEDAAAAAAPADDAPASSSSWGGSPVVSDGEEEEGGEEEQAPLPPPTPARPAPALLPAPALAAASDRIAALASAALASADDPVPSLKPLVEGAAHPDPRAARLALLSAAAVFADVLPGYRVRAPSDAAAAADGGGDEHAVLSKEVRALRAREGALLKCYRAFLRAAVATADAGASTPPADASPLASARRAAGRAAVRALGEVLARAPHFNHADDVLRALVPRLASPDPRVAAAAGDALASLFGSAARHRDGAAGVRGGGAAARLTRDGAQLVADLVKARKCRCAPAVLAPLAAIDLTPPTLAAHGGGAAPSSSAPAPPRRVGKKAAARAAKAARNALRRDPVAAARAAAAARPDEAEAALLASQTAEAVFEAYFRPVKHALRSAKLGPAAPGAPLTALDVATAWPLLLPSLRGLEAAVAGLSVDVVPDLHACLVALLASRRAPPALTAAALGVAAATLAGVGDALTVDRGGVLGGLFAALGRAPLLRPTDRGAPSGATGARLLGAATVLLADGGRSLDAAGAAAMAKRVAGAALLCGVGGAAAGGATPPTPPLDEPLALGLLALLDALLRRSRALRSAARRGAGGARASAAAARARAAAGAEDDSDDGGGCVKYGAVASVAGVGAPAGDWGAARAAAAGARAPLWELGEMAASPAAPPSVREAAAALVAQPEGGGPGPRSRPLTAGGGAPAAVVRAAVARLRGTRGDANHTPPVSGALAAASDAVDAWFVEARDAEAGGEGRAAGKVGAVVAVVGQL